MRAALELARAKNPGPERHPKGSIVLCASCWKPLYKLEHGISFGDRLRADTYRPLTEGDYVALADRAAKDHALNAGIAGVWRSWTDEQRRAMAHRVTTPRAGEQPVCPFCAKAWMFHWAQEEAEVNDRAYVCDLLTIPPDAPVPDRAVREWGAV